MIGAVLLLTLATAAPPAPPPEKLRCVKRLETGSLVKKTKVCHTRADWARINAGSQNDLEEMRRPSLGHTNGQ